MSDDLVWNVFCALVWFCSNGWHVAAAVAACLVAGLWLGARGERDMRSEAVALIEEENGAGWAADTAAIDAFNARIEQANRAADMAICTELWAMPTYDHITEEETR